MEPTMFIGSSVEGHSLAEEIQLNLQYQVEVTLWSQGVFCLSKGTLETLIEKAKSYDFALFVMSNDDLVKMRKTNFSIARDNVLFEFGLFIGSIGIERTFFLIPDVDDFHLPTDLIGITPAKYSLGSHGGNLSASLGPACTNIKKAITSIINSRKDLNGEWKVIWEVDSENFDEKNESRANIKQLGNKVLSQFETNGITYKVEGNINRANLITGIWGDPQKGASYFGPFQLSISPCGKKLDGLWSGFKKNGKIGSGKFSWERV